MSFKRARSYLYKFIWPYIFEQKQICAASSTDFFRFFRENIFEALHFVEESFILPDHLEKNLG